MKIPFYLNFVRVLLLILGVVVFLGSCDLVNNTTNLHIEFQDIGPEYSWPSQNQRRLFYINNSSIRSKEINIEAQGINIEIDKTGIMPVLACVLIPNVTSTIEQCALAMGATYPFDAIKNNLEYSLEVKAFHQAQVAQILLDLINKNIKIQSFNIAKLYDTIYKKSPHDLIDLELFQEYLSRSSFSSWGIKPLEKYSIVLPNLSRNWTSTSFWLKNINISETNPSQSYNPSSGPLLVAPGIWLFVTNYKYPNESTKDIVTTQDNISINSSPLNYLWLYVNRDGKSTVIFK